MAEEQFPDAIQFHEGSKELKQQMKLQSSEDTNLEMEKGAAEIDTQKEDSDEDTLIDSTTSDHKVSILGEESVHRGQWTGNVWRFPYLCYKNGGGSFLVVYAIFFAIGAVPIFIMEVAVGQYLQRGAIDMWKMCPMFKGVGIGNVVLSFMMASYYCTIIAWSAFYMINSFWSILPCISYFCIISSWSIFYMINSFSSTFPWETCDNDWNNKTSCVETSFFVNKTSNSSNSSQTAVEQYWENRVLYQTSSISDFGDIQWELLGLTFISWAIVYFALWKGITQARKFVYFCAIFPYILIAVLLVRGLTLPGAMTGVSFYLTPNITKLTEITVWKDAGTQVFYSYGVGFGTLIALGSHNKFYHNCYRDAILVCFINGGTSILAGFAIFSILGFMSEMTATPIQDIVKPGVGLAFVVYPEVASKLPGKQIWSFLFFLMISILGLDSQVCMLEGLFTALEDSFPLILRKYKKRFLLITCVFFFIIGIPMVTHAGAYWVTLVDSYGASGLALLFVVFFEVFGLAWGFGAKRINDAIFEMVGVYPLPCFTFLWKFTAPFSTLILFLLYIIMFEPLTGPNKKEYPFWAEAFGFFLSACSMIVIPGYALYYLFNTNDNIGPITRFRRGMHPPSELEI